MADSQILSGIGASAGVAIGPVVLVETKAVAVPSIAEPVETFKTAVTDVAADLVELAADARERGSGEAAEILKAQSLMAQDPMLADEIIEAIDGPDSVGPAIDTVVGRLVSMFEGFEDPYLAARSADVTEVADRIRHKLAGLESADLTALTEPSILVAQTLTAAETAQLDPAQVLGFATATGGPTSHVVVIARALGVPAVVGAVGIAEAVALGDRLGLDGSDGTVVVCPDAGQEADFGRRAARHAASVAAAEHWAGHRVSYGDASMDVAANVASDADLARAIEVQADGIGLLRTEFLFLDRPEPPSEDEQYAFYAKAASAFEDPVVIRTFDIGGDKPADYMTVDKEENPFLGVRGARLYSYYPNIFEIQVRAILRAAVHGDIWLMLPMITTLDEVLEIKEQILAIAESMPNAEIRVPKIGVMVEVPAIALTADAVAANVDFVSIGSNDLTQYAMAADRMNGNLGHLQDPLHPAVLALCTFTAAAAKGAGIPVSVCGLAAADPLGAAAFAAMGINKLSMSGGMVNQIKSTLGSLDPGPGHAAVENALITFSAEDARAAIRSWVDES
jgi:phosphoenolpyruvate-protein phosphotransferase